MRKVEAEAVVGYQRALLGHVAAKAVAQRCMDEVRRRVVCTNAITTSCIDFEMHRIADLDRPLGNLGLVRVQTPKRLVRRRNGDLQPLGRPDAPGIAGLAAAFTVERRLVGQHDHVVAFGRAIDFLAVLYESDDFGLARVGAVAGKLGRTFALRNVEPDFLTGCLARPFPRCARGCLLLRHGGIEAVLVDADTAIAQRVFRKVVGKAVSVVELERGLAVQRAALAHVAGGFVEELETLVERAAELGFLALQHFLDQRLAAHQLGIGSTHFADQFGHQAMHQRFACTQQVRVTHGAAHDAAKDVTAAFIARQDTVGQQKAGRTQVVGDNAVAGSLVAFGLNAGQRFAGADQGLEGVGVVIVVHALHDRCDTLDAHARVDARLGQVADDLVRFLRELHEDEVPDFDEAVAVFLWATRRAAPDVIAVVVEDFRTRATRTVRAHGPEIVLGRDADDLVIGKAGSLLPQVESFIVRVVDGNEQLLGIEPPLLGQQRPRMVDRLFLEIVAKAEIAEHFEERMVARRVADIVEIVVLSACAHAFLRARRARRRRRFKACESVLERHHARIDEHQRGIAERHQGCARHFLVPVGGEVIEERAADFVGRRHGLRT